MGLMQTETVHVTAEAYDVAMDISFPRGVYITNHCSLFCTYVYITSPFYMYIVCCKYRS